MQINNIFCQFQTSYAGKCLMHTPDGSGVCKKHQGMISKKKNTSPKFRGASKFYKKTKNWEGVVE